MAKDPIYLAFSTQKGGAGKTTLTVLVASYLHYVKGYDVAVIDCDYPQHSIVEMRGRDLKMAKEDEYYRNLAYEQFTRLNKKAYPVIFHQTALDYETIYISGGRIGAQVEAAPGDLIRLLRAQTADIIANKA